MTDNEKRTMLIYVEASTAYWCQPNEICDYLRKIKGVHSAKPVDAMKWAERIRDAANYLDKEIRAFEEGENASK